MVIHVQYINTTLPKLRIICFVLASGLDHLLTLHELFLGKECNDLTGALACATSYHIYHSSKIGRTLVINKAIGTGMFGHVRAYAYSSAKAFSNDYDIKSSWTILCCGFSGLLRDSSHLGFLANRSDQTVYSSHFQGASSLDN